MASYARKPSVLEAFQWTGEVKNRAPWWILEALVNGKLIQEGKQLLLPGFGAVPIGDYIIKEPAGAVSIRNKSVFEQNYYRL